ncbi:hypothetical protein SERLA73DRAFT_179700 [Serpula lacrymans var. lacrymans S7.3]|uniref:Uncharacterized protein n=2 Tax=Serpula lacrymans var. lacrymans TaxID=341189 RepID=F8PTY4_SERL3|nr:uncharacterized protein SERLADRAFT_464925 [Serpula lacrymans var. lacrymans S7.9]EGN99609.1 hypothetical protein SERLA73DRAFT_179700 [Serpula lacrymans var. lacrymans S7.3]EGO25177.1 hypothetical protein SERLADRAFT_464925 [Serpula lacrymans var. lacrymans S7.9]
MGVLLPLKYPLSIKHLAALLNLPPRILVKSFLSIQPILLIPESDDEPVHVVHTSLRDFLINPTRSGSYFINPPTCHLSIAIACLQIMKKNQDEFWFIEDEPLSYVCREWWGHIHEALSDGKAYWLAIKIMVILYHAFHYK